MPPHSFQDHIRERCVPGLLGWCFLSNISPNSNLPLLPMFTRRTVNPPTSIILPTKLDKNKAYSFCAQNTPRSGTESTNRNASFGFLPPPRFAVSATKVSGSSGPSCGNFPCRNNSLQLIFVDSTTGPNNRMCPRRFWPALVRDLSSRAKGDIQRQSTASNSLLPILQEDLFHC